MQLSSLKGIPIDRIPFLDLPPSVFVCRDAKKSQYIYSLLKKSQSKFQVVHLDSFDSEVYEAAICDYKSFIKRAIALTEIASPEKKIIVTHLSALNYRVPKREYFLEQLVLSTSQNVNFKQFLEQLMNFGYIHASVVRNVGEYSVRGGIIDLYSPAGNFPVRIDFLGNEVDSIKRFDLETQISVEPVDSILITKCSEIVLTDKARELFSEKFQFPNGFIAEAVENGNFFPGIEWYLDCFHETTTSVVNYLDPDTKFIFDFELEKLNQQFFEDAQTRYVRNRNVLPVDQIFTDSVKLILDQFEVLQTQLFCDNCIFSNHDVTYNIRDENSLNDLRQNLARKSVFSVKSNGAMNILTGIVSKVNRIERFSEAQAGQLNAIISDLDVGFKSDHLEVYTEKELFGAELKFAAKKPKSTALFSNYSNLTVGDYVVHEKHGIAIFEGLATLEVDNIAHEFLLLRYKNDDKLYIPVENISLVTRYGDSASEVELDVLKSNSWATRKSKVRKKLLVIANDLLKLSAQRKLNRCEPMELPERYEEFCKGFGHLETDDQLSAIEDIIQDLTVNDIPMDRLVCGDVGFGKTEVALRAAYIAAANGKQVVLLAPTTILVSQHYKNFLKRFEGFGIKVCQLSRFATASEMRQNLKDIASGEAKIITATHSVLSGKVKFADLGLVIIDEEQHFGVRHKEFLKKAHDKAHFMTLSATPIPRTLQLSISGVKDLSMITTPPMERLPVRTIVSEFDKRTIKEAIEHEVKVGGQVFVVTPRVEFLDNLFDQITALFPDLTIGKVHGKSKDIEEVIRDFCDCKIQVLVSTNIIDSGIDIPNANTILIHRVDLFGLSQLYQLRGRVGRSKRQAYAYLMLNNKGTLTESAQKRLEVLSQLNKLGSGFTLASHDLDIRGAGNLLGEEQSGYIKEVGVELYQSMLQEAILMLKSGVDIDQIGKKEIQINLGVPVIIPESYIPDADLRLEMYRRIGNIETISEIASMEYELSDRFGVIPSEVRNLLTLIGIKINCSNLNIEKLDVGSGGIIFSFFDNICPDVDRLMDFLTSKLLKQYADGAKIRPDQKVVILKKWNNVDDRTKDTNQIINLFSRFLTEF